MFELGSTSQCLKDGFKESTVKLVYWKVRKDFSDTNMACPHKIFKNRGKDFGHFPFVRTEKPDHSHHIGNFSFNQEYPHSQISQILKLIVCMEEMVFQQNLLESLFLCQNDWSGHGLAGQFWLSEISALSLLFSSTCTDVHVQLNLSSWSKKYMYQASMSIIWTPL